MDMEMGSIRLVEEMSDGLPPLVQRNLPQAIVDLEERFAEAHQARGEPPVAAHEVQFIEDAATHPHLGQILQGHGIRSLVMIPLWARDRIIGEATIASSRTRTFDESDRALLISAANIIGVAIETAQLLLRERMERQRAQMYAEQATEARQRLEQTYLSTIRSLVAALEARDAYTASHTERVKGLALLIADKMGLSQKEKETLAQAAELHDLGKVAIPDGILLKPGGLNDAEWDIMRSHPIRSVEMIEGLDFLRDVIPIIRAHHERYDGAGYPDGLKGEEIPPLARILSVADAYDALTSDRPYRAGFSREKAMEILRENAGTQWDAKVVDTLLASLSESAQVV